MPVRTLKRRYIALKIMGDEVLNRFQLINYIKSCLSQIDGVELDKVKLRLIELDLERKNCIIRCTHKYSQNVKDCLQYGRIGDSEIIVRVLGVSGTIKALRRKFLTN
jgi:ribonuclease P/MRP protein subunit POP5